MPPERLFCPACGVEREVLSREKKDGRELITFKQCGHHYHKVVLTEIIKLMDSAKATLRKIGDTVPRVAAPLAIEPAMMQFIQKATPILEEVYERTRPTPLWKKLVYFILTAIISGIVGFYIARLLGG